MKISIFSLDIWEFMNEFDIDRLSALKRAAALGITALDIDAIEFDNDYTIESLKPMLKETGITVSSVYGFCALAAADEVIFQKSIELGKHYVDIAKQLNAFQLMIVPVYGDCIVDMDDKLRARERICEGFPPVIEYAAKHGIMVSFENYSQSTAPLAFGDDLEYILTSTPNLHFTFDTGNFRCLNVDALEVFERLKGYISHVHLKDWKIDGVFPSHFVSTDGADLYGCSLGDGIIPIGLLLERLCDSGYDDFVCVEHNYMISNEASTKRSVDYIKKIIK